MNAEARVLEQELSTAAFFADPYPAYHRLRALAPVFWSETWQAWVVTRFADVLAVLHDAARFSNHGRQTLLLQRLTPEVRASLVALEDHYAQGGLSNLDPPAHTRLRALISKAFTPRTIEAMRADIETLVDDLLDAHTGSPGFDLIRDFAYPLPALVIARLLGLPAEDCDQFKQWSDEVTAFLGTAHATPDSAVQGQASLVSLRAYLADQVNRRRSQPGPDLLSALLAAQERGQVLSAGELLGTCVTLLLGGHETTTNLIGNGMLALLRHPDQWRQFDDDDLLPGAVDELLRYDSPVQRAWRVVTEDLVLNGQPIARGQLVFAMLGAANRDPEQFAMPDQLDVSRRSERHLSFGYGIHYCLGAPLAKLEAAIALRALRLRWPAMRLPAGSRPDWKANMAFRGLRSLPVSFS